MKLIHSLKGSWLFALLASLALALNGCGGSSSSTPASSALSGTAATGAPIAGHIEITGANGQALTNVVINSDGSYSADVSSLSAPFVIVAVPDDGTLPRQYSYAAATNNWNTQASNITANALTTAQARINANFASQFQAQGLDASSYDLLYDYNHI